MKVGRHLGQQHRSQAIRTTPTFRAHRKHCVVHTRPAACNHQQHQHDGCGQLVALAAPLLLLYVKRPPGGGGAAAGCRLRLLRQRGERLAFWLWARRRQHLCSCIFCACRGAHAAAAACPGLQA